MRALFEVKMKTISIKQSEIEKNWWVADADGQTLGRFASEIAQILRGKHKVNFTPHMDMGDFVVVINAEKIRLTGSNETEKTYFRNTGYPGGGKEISVAELRRKHPEHIVKNAIKGMLPHNRLGRQMMRNLKIYSGPDHPHSSQQPKVMEF